MLAGCGKDADAQVSANGRVTVFAAASLKEGLTDLSKQFEDSHPDTHVTTSFGGSQDLAMQIQKGAPANVFISADYDQMKIAGASGRFTNNDIREFAENSMVIIAWPRSLVQTPKDLAKPKTRVVLADTAVPAGNYSKQVLSKLQGILNDPNYSAAVQHNVKSYEEDVKAVLAKVELGEADAGIVYKTDAAASHGKVRTIPIPDGANVLSRYYIAPVDQWYRGAKEYVAYTLSPDGQKILSKHGFLHAAK